MTRCDGQRVKRRNRPGSRASPGGRPGAALPRVRGPLDQADRRPSRSLAGDGQGVLLRPDRREGAGGQGALRRACAAAAAPTRSRATARATPTRTARPAIPARSSGAGRGSACSTRCCEWRARYGRLPSSYDWSRTHARRRGGEALERLAEGDWPPASVVSRAVRNLGGRPRGGCAARSARAHDGGVGGCRQWAASRFRCVNPGNRPR